MYYVHYSYQLALISIFTFVVLLILSKPWRTYFNPKANNSDKNIYLFYFLYITTCIFAFWEADTYHSWDGFIEAKQYINNHISGYESIYNWLAKVSAHNYFLWRTFVWLPACVFLFLIVRLLNLRRGNMLLSFALFGLMLSFTRGMLGHTMLLLGIVLCIDKDRKKIERIVGFVLLCLSYFFHKSIYINIIFALLALFSFGKKSFKLSLIAFPFLVAFANSFVDGIVSGAFMITLGDGVGGVGDRTYLYASAEQSLANTSGKISNIIEYVPEYITMLYLVDRVLFKGYFRGMKKEGVFTYLFKLTYISIYISSLFAFIDTSSFIYSRLKYMGFFPMLFVLGKIWSIEPKTNNWIKLIIILQLFSLFWQWSYKIYNWSMI